MYTYTMLDANVNMNKSLILLQTRLARFELV